MKISLHFQIFLSCFFLCGFGSFLARYRVNPNYSARIGQATNSLALERKDFQFNRGFPTFHNKNFVRKFCAEIEPEKFYLKNCIQASAEAEITAHTLGEPDILSRWHFEILFKDYYSGEKSSILAIPRVEIRKAAKGNPPHYFSDLNIANDLVEAVRKVKLSEGKSDSKLRNFPWDWIIVREVIYNDVTYRDQFIKLSKNSNSTPDWEKIEDLIKKSKLGWNWRSGPDGPGGELKGDF
jgi:hypothetical protein